MILDILKGGTAVQWLSQEVVGSIPGSGVFSVWSRHVLPLSNDMHVRRGENSGRKWKWWFVFLCDPLINWWILIEFWFASTGFILSTDEHRLPQY